MGCYCADEARCHRSVLRALLREHGAAIAESDQTRRSPVRTWCATVFSLAALALPLESREVLAQTPGAGGFAVVFYSGRAGNDDIFILRPGQREPVNLTRHPARDQCPAASPDGRRIAFLSESGGNFEVYQVDADGGNPVRFTNHPAWDGWASFVRPARR